MKKHSYIIILLITQLVCAQQKIDFRSPAKSPDVYKFEQYLSMPVNLNSGTPQISIPIYTVSYSGMTLPISLEYDASGVKVEDIASSVGLKWTLNVGGVVSRIVKGAPDEGSPFRGNASPHPDPNKPLNMYGFYRDYGLSRLESELNKFSAPATNSERYWAFNNFLDDCYLGYRDSQPDLFYFSTPEGGSKFVFNEKREVVYLENTDFFVKANTLAAGANFDSWNITSPNGIQYTFGIDNVNSANKVIERSAITDNGDNASVAAGLKTDAWFLNAVKNYATNEVITIDYFDNNYSNLFNSIPSKNTDPCIPLTQGGSQCGVNGNDYDNFAYSTLNRTLSESHVYSKLISKITAGKTVVNFIYNTNRDDVMSEAGFIPKRLDEIDVLYDGIIIKKFKLLYSTVTSAGLEQVTNLNKKPLYKRLILDGFSETSSNDLLVKPYVFTYNTQLLPNRCSFAMDRWGFYNGQTSNATLVPKTNTSQTGMQYANRKVDFNFAVAGVLEKITYPTKGSVTFSYQTNMSEVQYDFNLNDNNSLAVGGLRVYKIINNPNDSTLPTEKNYTYFDSKLTSTPRPYYKIFYDYDNMYNVLSTYSPDLSSPSILSLGNLQHFKTFINPTFKTGYYYYDSSGIDLLDVNFMGPHITYGKVIETDNNSTTEHYFHWYKNYFELDGNYSQTITLLPAEPKFQTLLAGEKRLTIQKNKDGNEVMRSENDFVVTTSAAKVVALNVVKMDFGSIYYPYTIRGQIKRLQSVTEKSTQGTGEVQDITNYEYSGNNHNQVTKSTVINSKGETLISKMYYPLDMIGEPYMSNLRDQNRKATPIKVETYKKTTSIGDKLSEQRTVYGVFTSLNNLILPASVYAAKFPNYLPSLTTPNVGQLEKKVSSDVYDTNGTLLQYTPADGRPVNIIWGYNKTQPIAKIENIDFNLISTSIRDNLQNLSNTNNNEANLLVALQSLRDTFPNGSITTYTYKPEVGVSTVTDPKGYTMYYTYDGLGRLESVKDATGNTLSKNEYHYKN